MVLLDACTRTAWPPLASTLLPSSQLWFDPSSKTKGSPAPAPAVLPTMALLDDPLVSVDAEVGEVRLSGSGLTLLSDAALSWMAAHSFCVSFSPVTALRTVPGLSTTP